MKLLQKIRKERYVILSVVGLCIIVGIALVFPEQYFSYYDRRTQSGVSYLQTDVNIYQVEYATFAEKLFALGELYNSNDTLNSVLIQGVSDDERMSEILKALKNELEEWPIYELALDYNVFNADNLTACGLYSIYVRESGQNDIRAFNYWKIKFEDDDGDTYSIALDEEFQKIYSMKITYSDDENEEPSSSDYLTDSKSAVMYEYSLPDMIELFLQYYGLDSYNYYYSWDTAELRPELEVYDTDGNVAFTIGFSNSYGDIYIGIVPSDNFFEL